MTAGFSIEPLAGQHDRKGFSCGVDVLDRYFRERVGQDIRRRMGNCFVALDREGEIAGYYTLAASSVPVLEIPSDMAAKLPRYPVLPAGLIGRLAVDRRFAGQGLGTALIVDAIARAIQSEVAIFALAVDAKDEAAKAFYERLGFIPFQSRPLSLFLPLSDAGRFRSLGLVSV